MIADDADRLHVQLADPHPVKQIAEAVVEAGDHEQHLAPRSSHPQRQVETEALHLFIDAGAEGRLRLSHREGDPHEEHAGFRIIELMRFENVAAMGRNAHRNGSYDAAAIGAAKRQDIVGHVSPPL